MSTTVIIGEPEDLGAVEILAVACGSRLELTEDLVLHINTQRATVLEALSDPHPVYGINTGMGAASSLRLSEEQQRSHQARLMLARQVGTEPWMAYETARAAVATRLRTFLNGDAGVSADLCQAFIDLLNHDLAPAIPESSHGAAGEIIPAAHIGGALAGVGYLIDVKGGSDHPRDAAEVLQEAGLTPYEFGPKEGIATLQGTPVAIGAALRFVHRARRIAQLHLLVLASTVRLTASSRDPYDPRLARGDCVLEGILNELNKFLGDTQEVRALQAPVSFRVTPPALAHFQRSVDQLAAAALRCLEGVSDSPAFVEGRFIGTPAFDGFALAAHFDAVRTALLHLGELSTTRLHRLLDERINGRSAQLSADPGTHAGLIPVHKGAVGVIHRVLGESAPFSLGLRETSFGQEDAQSFALEAYSATLRAAQGVRHVLACELLALVQVLRLDGDGPETLAHPDTVRLLRAAERAAAPGVHDRRWGQDIASLIVMLRKEEA